MPSRSTIVEGLAALVVGDATLPPSVRSEASRIHREAWIRPQRALDDLDNLHRRVVPTLTCARPTESLARCVSIETFFLHHLRSDIRYRVGSSQAYQSRIGQAADPSAALRHDLAVDPILFPAEFSWMAPLQRLGRLTGTESRHALGTLQEPPFVVFVLPLSRLRSALVVVRPPCAIDAIPGRNHQWRPPRRQYPPTELVDRDIPLDALREVRWRP